MSFFLTTFATQMKKDYLYIVFSILLSAFQLSANAQTVTYSDSVEISLLTCSPGKEIWSHYGHTAIRYNDYQNGNDLAINYGLFSPSQPYFILRFIFGLTDYRVGIEPMGAFLEQYKYEGRGVIEQKLKLTKEEKYKIFMALKENLKPENLVYRYNYFYDNCTTRAERMLLDHINRKITTESKGYCSENSYRECIHKWNSDYKWAQFGEDLLLGLEADEPFDTHSKANFLPDNLRKFFNYSKNNGKPLVKTTIQLLKADNYNTGTEGFPISPIQVSIIFAIIAAIALILRWNTNGSLWWIWDLFQMIVSGIIGMILFAMIFSKHPCVNLNFIIFIFNPLCLVFLIPSIKKTKQGLKDWWWTFWGIFIILGLTGCFFQRIPFPVVIVALFLLLNCIMHHKGVKVLR